MCNESTESCTVGLRMFFLQIETAHWIEIKITPNFSCYFQVVWQLCRRKCAGWHFKKHHCVTTETWFKMWLHCGNMERFTWTWEDIWIIWWDSLMRLNVGSIIFWTKMRFLWFCLCAAPQWILNVLIRWLKCRLSALAQIFLLITVYELHPLFRCSTLTGCLIDRQ